MKVCILAGNSKFVAALGLAVAAGSVTAAPPNKTTAPAPLMVYDSQGKAVGRVYNDYAVVMMVGGSAVLVELHAQEDFLRTDFLPRTVYFTGLSCTGQAYLMEGNTLTTNGMARSTVATNEADGRYLYPSIGGKRVLVDIRSQFDSGCKPYSWPGAYPMIPAGAPVDLNGFVPPFSVK